MDLTPGTARNEKEFWLWVVLVTLAWRRPINVYVESDA